MKEPANDKPAPKTFTLDDIAALQRKAVEKKWAYPYLFNSLKKLGVERYEVTVATHETKYVGGGTSVTQGAPDGWQVLAPSEKYDLAALKNAIARSQAGEITYGQFLAEIAAAGVSFYRVDMRPRTVTYHGQKPYKLVEPVPDTVA